MAKTRVDPAFNMRLPGAGICGGNVVSFIFTCKALSDGTQKTIFARLEITANGDVNVCDFEVTGGPIPDKDQGTALVFPDNSNMDEGIVETYYLADLAGGN